MKKFLKDVLKRMAVTLVSTILFLLISLFLFEAIFSALLDKDKPEAVKGSYLVLDLSMNLTDRPSELSLEDITKEAITDERKPPSFHLKEVLDAIEKAQTDPKITGIFVKGSFRPDAYGCGYSAIHELIQGLKDFKKTEKRILGFFSAPSQLDYLVYSICDELHMNPSGTLILNGLANEQVFFGEAFERYGVGVQVVRVGEFKGAVEPFISTQFSEENRMQIARLLELRWTNYLNTISLHRGIEKEELVMEQNQTFLFSPESCKEKGLIDFITPHGKMLDTLLKLGVEDEDSEEYAHVDLIDYVDRSSSTLEKDSSPEIVEAKLALVYIEGTIVEGGGDDGSTVGGDEIAQRIREIARDDDYKAIILRVNSPGGSVSGSDAILSELSRARAGGLPIVVSMGSVAASGGYWVAMDSDRIFAHEQTITGSIGVFGLLPNVKDLMKNFSLHWDVVKTHQSADLMGVSRPKTSDELSIVQQYVGRIYDRFINLVSSNRDINASRVAEIAQGRVWMGVDALELGLIDELGGLKEAIAHGVALSGVDEYEIVEFPALRNPMDTITEIFDVQSFRMNGSAHDSPFLRTVKEMKGFIKQIECLNDPRHSYSILPWYRGGFGFSQ